MYPFYILQRVKWNNGSVLEQISKGGIVSDMGEVKSTVLFQFIEIA